MSKSSATTKEEDATAMIQRMGEAARKAYRSMADASNARKNIALVEAAMQLRAKEKDILAANGKDLAFAKEQKLDAAMIDRLTLNHDRVEAMAATLETIAIMDDPVGRSIESRMRPNGLVIEKVGVPLGVIGIIYESRPNVTADAAGLCLKSGNACILRGGSESLHSSQAILDCIHAGMKKAGLPLEAVQLVATRDRAAVTAMLQATGLIDVVIPRGGKSLNQRVLEESKVPTLLHLEGNCHTYIHASADPAMAEKVLLNAKMRRVGICGATESLLIDKEIAKTLLPALIESLIKQGCELRGDALAQSIDKRIKSATDADWQTEYLAPILSIKTVEDIEEAIRHINAHGSHHTDAIIAKSQDAADEFMQRVDSAIVMHNTSTQFADGGEFGLGAEIGISTGRLHARGPVGADELTTYKYVVRGNGQIRS